MESLLTDLTEWLKLNPNWAGLVVLIVAALESFLVVGLFVPGTVVMFGIGAMVAAGNMELIPTLIWAATGAIIGDGSSYFIGRHYHQQLRVMWPFRKYPKLISGGMDFFHKHGGKSIVMARFVGPVRPLVPAVAGMLDMPAKRFFLVNVLSAIIWAPAYMAPGLLFGASLGVATEIAGHLALLIAVLVALLWFSWWSMRRIIRSLQPHALSIQMRVLELARKHRTLEPLAAALLDPNHPEARGITILTGVLLVTSWILLTIPHHLAVEGLFTNVDLYLFNGLQNLRSPVSDQLLIAITELGNGLVLYAFTLLISIWLLIRGYWRAAVHWLITVIVVGLLTQALKLHTAVPRPPIIDANLFSYAFPSGHASLSVAVYGFLAVIIARELRRNWHWVPYSFAAFIIVAIGFSRLYLGAHWLSDVLAGWSLGLLWVALMGIAYRHHPSPAIPLSWLTPLSIGVLSLVAVTMVQYRSDTNQLLYQVQEPTPQQWARNDWLQNDWQSLPQFRSDMGARQNQPMDIQWTGSIKTIRRVLLEQGWEPSKTTDTSSFLDLFNDESTLQQLPVLPQIHAGQTQRLLLTRYLDDHPDKLLTLRLWHTNYLINDKNVPLWTGNVSWLYIEKKYWMFHFLRTLPDFSTPLQVFTDQLKSFEYRTVQRTGLPAAANVINWNGNVLLIIGKASAGLVVPPTR